MIDVAEQYLILIKTILQKTVPDYETWAFGSRVTGKAKPYSDLDLVLIGKQKLDRRQKMELKEAFAESDLPFRVDILDWNTLSDNFKPIIQQQYERIL